MAGSSWEAGVTTNWLGKTRVPSTFLRFPTTTGLVDILLVMHSFERLWRPQLSRQELSGEAELRYGPRDMNGGEKKKARIGGIRSVAIAVSLHGRRIQASRCVGMMHWLSVSGSPRSRPTIYRRAIRSGCPRKLNRRKWREAQMTKSGPGAMTFMLDGAMRRAQVGCVSRLFTQQPGVLRVGRSHLGDVRACSEARRGLGAQLCRGSQCQSNCACSSAGVQTVARRVSASPGQGASHMLTAA